jgi:hypothetical protein
MLVALLAAALAAAGSAAAPAPPQPNKTLSPDEEKEVAALLEKFRGPAALQDRQRAADRLLEIGGPAPRRLLPAIQDVATPIIQDYGREYLAPARAAYLAKVQAAGLKKIQALRRRVLAMRSSLSRRALETEGDAALRELHTALWLTPQEVCAQSGDLRQRRETVLALDATRRRCEGYYERPVVPRPGRPPPWRPDRGGLAELLGREEQWVALLALSENDRDVMVLEENRKAEASLAPAEVLGIREANRVRLLLGVGALATDLKLCQAARDHTADMARLNFVSHESPLPGKRLPWDRAARFGATCQSENTSYGGWSAAAIVRRWFISPQHHVNLLNREYYRCGFGNTGQYWVIMFGR